jgi:hypothetical protein
MDSLTVLIGLLEEISKGTPEGIDDRSAILKELLRKVARNSMRVHIEVDYDGQEFHWRVPCANITAAEWAPRNLRAKAG